MEKIRWGLMGAGKIVSRWINGARQLEDMEIVAVASRSMETAKVAAERYSIPDATTYDGLAERDDIDIVYVPVPHTAHKELAIKAMEHGKSVLVEKPIAVSAADACEMIECAKANGVFMMEAVWTRFFPMMEKVYSLFGNGGIGEVRAVTSAFSSRVPSSMASGRLLNPELAGGGLLDVGVYPLHFSDMIYGKAPVAITGYAAINSDEHKFGVDEQEMIIAQYDRGELASMMSGVRTAMPSVAQIFGTKGRIELPVFWKPTVMRVTIGREETREYNMPVELTNPDYADEGFSYELRHVHECLRNGLTESPVMTWEKSLRIMEQCDTLRAQWGLKFPFEK